MTPTTRSAPTLATRARQWLPRLLAIGLLVWALQRAGLANVWRSLAGADPLSVGLAVLLVAPFVVVRAARWRVILRDLGIRVGHGLATRLYAIGLYLGTITPGQAGDAVKAWFLRRRGESLAVSLLSCVLDRLFDVLVLAALATTALVVFWPEQQAQRWLGAAIIGAVAVALVLLARPAVRRTITGLPLVRLVWRPIEYRVRLLPWGVPLLDSQLHWPTLGGAVALTGLGFVVTLTRVYLIFHAVGVDLPVLAFVAVASVTVFASLVSVAGVGSRDIALIALLTPFGYSEDQAVAASFLILFLTLTNIIPGLVAWFAGDEERAAGAAYEAEATGAAAPSLDR
ncbi:MAG: flippase-like domain-containing protein [Chloroflexi bacterium]|nr:flippase-like domain-containing protein [Chloroflexota bacterium]